MTWRRTLVQNRLRFLSQCQEGSTELALPARPWWWLTVAPRPPGACPEAAGPCYLPLTITGGGLLGGGRAYRAGQGGQDGVLWLFADHVVPTQDRPCNKGEWRWSRIGPGAAGGPDAGVAFLTPG